MIGIGKRFFFGVLSVAGAWILGAMAYSPSVLAANETYTWKDYRTIVVSGGDMQGTSELKLVADKGDPSLTGEQIGRLYGTLMRKEGCQLQVSFYIYEGSNRGLLWNPPPYGETGVGTPGGLPRCDLKDEWKNIDPSYHNQFVNIQGTRPPSPDAPEREEEKLVRVTLLSPEPMSRAPASVKITIKKAGAVVAEQSVPPQDDSGAANYPPDQTPVFYGADFTLEPGDYQVCATFVITECRNFTKEKYKFLTLTYGTAFEPPHERKIIVNVVVPYERPCGSTFTTSPYTVTATGPSGNVLTQDTPPGQVTPAANEQGAICTVNGTLTLRAEFVDGTEPGTWRLCVLAANTCVDGVKVAGQPLEVTIRTLPLPVAPENDPVCSTGTGMAGMTAWIICPLTDLMLKATAFIERNFIVPFLTISPLKAEANDPVYRLWESMRNVANVAFIIAFMIVIFSQATSIGISNYGIKRLLPRIALIAIGTNLSFFIVGFAIDAFNIFGAGVSDLVLNVITAGGGGAGQNPNGGSIFALSVVGLSGIALAATITTAGPLLGWIFGLFAVAFLIILVAVVVLILRHMVIIILVIVSPLAFVTWLLPNTEKYFARWRQTLIQLLFMYPLIVLVFASGKIVQALILSGDFDLVASLANASLALLPGSFIAQADSQGIGTREDFAEVVKLWVAFIAGALPLVLLPLTFAASGSIMKATFNAFQGKARDWSGKGKEKASERLSPWLKERRMQLARSEKGGWRGSLARSVGGTRALKREAIRKSRKAEYERAEADYLNKRIAAEPQFAKAAAGIGGKEGEARVVARAEGAINKLRDQELKMSLRQLKNSVMAHEGAKLIDAAGNRSTKRDTDTVLVYLANGGSVETDDGKILEGASALTREAAMQRLADDGRSDQIRTIQDYYNSLPNPQVGAAGNAMLTRAIKENYKALIGKAPDLVKGPGSAFGDANGETMAAFNAGTVAAMAQYMSKQQARSVDTSLSVDDRNKASANYDLTLNKFRTSLKSIADTPSLSSKFSGDAGKRIIKIAGGKVSGVNATVATAIDDAIKHYGFSIDPASGKVGP